MLIFYFFLSRSVTQLFNHVIACFLDLRKSIRFTIPDKFSAIDGYFTLKNYLLEHNQAGVFFLTAALRSSGSNVQVFGL